MCVKDIGFNAQNLFTILRPLVHMTLFLFYILYWEGGGGGGPWEPTCSFNMQENLHFENV